MASQVAKLQDMPPCGGYKSINYKRVPARSYFSGWAMIGGYLGMTAVGCFLFYLTDKLRHHEALERRSANFALYPMLLAERDREYLKQLRRNRDEEAKLMANVEGWKVGTYFGEPIYHTVPEDTLIEPSYHDYYAHAGFKAYAKRAHLSYWS